MTALARLGGRKFVGLVVSTAAIVYLVKSGGDTGNITVAIGAIGGMYAVLCGGNALIEKYHTQKATE